MTLTLGVLKAIIQGLDDDIILADLGFGNANFKTFTGVKRVILLENKENKQKYLTINSMGSHFTGSGDQEHLKYAGISFDDLTLKHKE